MAAADWVFGLAGMPQSTWYWDDGLKRVARPIYNAYVIHFAPEIAEALMLRDIVARGIEIGGAVVYGHEETT